MELGSGKKAVAVGLFDSGVGGLSVLTGLERLAQANPEIKFRFVYLADTARCPYGNRDADELRSFVGQIVGFLAGQRVDHLVMACNTSAAVALDFARRISTTPVHDLISATARHLPGNYRKIGVMATHATAKSHVFANRFRYFGQQAEVVELACPKLVPLVESGDIYSDKTKAILMEYTSVMEAEGVDAIILGCTHFPFLRTALAALLPKEIALIDPADSLMQQLAADLGLKLPAKDASTVASAVSFHVTGNPTSFMEAAQICLGAASSVPFVGNVSPLSLDKLAAAYSSTFDGTGSSGAVSNVIPLSPPKSADGKLFRTAD